MTELNPIDIVFTEIKATLTEANSFKGDFNHRWKYVMALMESLRLSLKDKASRSSSAPPHP